MKPGRLLVAMTLCLAQTLQASISDSFIETHREQLDSLFTRLDRSDSRLAPPVDQWQRGEHSIAAASLVSYFRQQAFDLTLLEPATIPEDLIRRAEQAVNNIYYIHSAWIKVSSAPSGFPVWNHGDGLQDKEIAWMLNRQIILPMLAEAYEQSGRTEFKAYLNGLIVNWIETNPYPDRMTFSPQWRPLEVARRILNSWTHVFHGYRPLLEDETLLLMLVSLQDHADALYEHASFWGGNHLLTEKIALLALAMAWPEFADSRKWSDDAVTVVSREILDQSYPDGSYKELSNHYQRVVLINAIPFLKLLRVSAGDTEHAAIQKRIEDMWDFFARSMKPDGSGPLNNASDQEENARFLKSAWQFFNRQDWLGMASNGSEGILPAGEPSSLFPWAGQVLMRNHWGSTGDWVYFDAGPYGTAHQHVDRFHLSVTLDGVNLLSDSGRYTYQPGKWKDYFQGSRGHTVLLLDGQPSRQGPRAVRQPMPINFRILDGAVYASAEAQFNAGLMRAPIPWRRHVIYDKRGFVIVLDHIVTFSGHQAELLWQFAPGVTEKAAGQIVSGIESIPVERQIQRGKDATPVAGYYSAEYSKKEAAPQLSCIYSIDQPTTLAHLISSPGSGLQLLTGTGTTLAGQFRFEVRDASGIIATGTVDTADKGSAVDYRPF